jgi:hypothetical protein
LGALGVIGLVLLSGCAPDAPPPQRRAAPTAIGPKADWSLELPRLLPGINACLAQTDRAVGVTKAWPIEYDLTGARLLKEDGERLDCVVAGDGSAILLTEPVRAASLLAGEREPLYTPGRVAPRQTSCLDAVPVADETGSEVGWLSYDSCQRPRVGTPSAKIEPPRQPKPRDEAG